MSHLLPLLTLLLALLPASPLCAAEPAWNGVMPTTNAEWQKLKGVVIEVKLNVSENQTRIELLQDQVIAIVPNPEDTWYTTWHEASHKPVDHRGDMSLPAGWSKQLQIRGYPGGSNNGPFLYDDKKSGSAWINVCDLHNHTFTGPGMVVLRGCLFFNQGTGKGAIRVKLVPVKSGLAAKP